MKKSLIIALMLFSVSAIQAQTGTTNRSPLYEKSRAFFEKISYVNKHVAQKRTRVLDSRLVAEAYEEAMLEDSSTYRYSGYRGSILEAPYFVFFEEINYDYKDTYNPFTSPQLKGRSYRSYNGWNQVYIQSDSNFIGTTFFPSNRSIYSYTHNLPTTILNEYWASSSWLQSSKLENIYTGLNQTEQFRFTWNGTGWDSSTHIVRTFNGNKLSTEIEYYYFSNAWVPGEKRILTYNANNQVLTEEYQAYQSNAWVNSRKDTMMYNTNGELIEFLYLDWDSVQWNNAYRSLLTWTNDRPTTVESQEWNGTSWDNTEKYNFTYNSAKYITSEEALLWDGTNYVYNPSNGSYKNRYYYETYNNNVGVKDYKNELLGEINIYPNPTSDYTTVSWEKDFQSQLEIVLLDMRGNIVSSYKTSGNKKSVQIALDKLSSGSYLLQLKSKDALIHNAIFFKL